MCERFRQDTVKFYTGNVVNAQNNASFGVIAKIILENFGQKIEDLTLTQINAYVLEYIRAKETEKKKIKGSTQVLTGKESLDTLKHLGFKIRRKAKHV